MHGGRTDDYPLYPVIGKHKTGGYAMTEQRPRKASSKGRRKQAAFIQAVNEHMVPGMPMIPYEELFKKLTKRAEEIAAKEAK